VAEASGASELDPRPGFWDKCEHELEPKSNACLHCGVPLSKVSGLPMRPVPPCDQRLTSTVGGVVQHEWAPELHYGTSFGLVLECKRCGRLAQCEIEALPTDFKRKSWRKLRDRQRIRQAARWAYCPKWKAGDLPHQPSHHRWPDRIALGPVMCQKCKKGAVVARIFDHPGGDGGRTDPQVWARRFRAVFPD